MAVKTLDDATKTAIVAIYKAGGSTISQLANKNGISRSTIRRILNDAGEYTPEQLERSQGDLAMDLLKQHNIKVTELSTVLYKSNKRLDRAEIIKVLMELEEGTWQTLLNEVIMARVALAANVHTQTRMLQLEEKVKANERDSKVQS